MDRQKDIKKPRIIIAHTIFPQLANPAAAEIICPSDIFCIGKGNILSTGDDIAIFTTGSILEEVYNSISIICL